MATALYLILREKAKNMIDESPAPATISDPPYFSGAGWDEKMKAWVKENIPADLTADWTAEANIAWSLSGGRPSEHFNRELHRAIQCYREGSPFIGRLKKWNEQQIALADEARKLR